MFIDMDKMHSQDLFQGGTAATGPGARGDKAAGNRTTQTDSG